MTDFDLISQNAAAIKANIAAAARRAGRAETNPVGIIGVTKTIDIERIKMLTRCGITGLGENRVQELMEKYDKIPGSDWHLIGRLQTNKVKYVVGKVSLIHSVDSLRLAGEISKRAEQNGIVQDILAEINIAKEESKGGVFPEEAETFCAKLTELNGIRLAGLMCIAPFVDNPEENRVFFRKMRELFVDIQAKNIDNIDMRHLSMGMTADYEVAVEEGATLVRIGTGFFGGRIAI